MDDPVLNFVVVGFQQRLADLRIIARTLDLAKISTVPIDEQIIWLEAQIAEAQGKTETLSTNGLKFLDPQVEPSDVLIVPEGQGIVRCKNCGADILVAINKTKGFPVWFHVESMMQQCYSVMPIAEPDR